MIQYIIAKKSLAKRVKIAGRGSLCRNSLLIGCKQGEEYTGIFRRLFRRQDSQNAPPARRGAFFYNLAIGILGVVTTTALWQLSMASAASDDNETADNSSLTIFEAGTNIVAADVNNNFAMLQARIEALETKLAALAPTRPTFLGPTAATYTGNLRIEKNGEPFVGYLAARMICQNAYPDDDTAHMCTAAEASWLAQLGELASDPGQRYRIATFILASVHEPNADGNPNENTTWADDCHGYTFALHTLSGPTTFHNGIGYSVSGRYCDEAIPLACCGLRSGN
ncbi:MAG: hypothetical protein HUU55_22170 [Myxococcales bacterium]|nr:hypothetical protein [Myxococcales bacterium]